MQSVVISDVPVSRSAVTAGAGVAGLWNRYARLRDLETRNLLIEHYLPLVEYHAARVHVTLPEDVQLDDLKSAGAIGLLEAVERFDLAKGVLFPMFAGMRIRGAIMDHLRAMDWAPRQQRRRVKEIFAATEAAREKDGHLPTLEELAAAMGVKRRGVEDKLREAREVGMDSLPHNIFETHRGRQEIGDALPDARQEPVDGRFAVNDFMDWLCKGFSRAEYLIVVLYYREGLTMRQVGATLGVSESLVSRMHSSILLRMKARMPREGLE
jgi:RNA polymerase sigma factor for flagellar operon FliA